MRSVEPADDNLPLAAPDAGRRVTWRSVLLGSLGVCLVCGFTPYNDFVCANTFLVGNYLPIVIVVTFFILTVLVNGPLHRWLPRYALSSGELAIILLMMLVSCGLPSQGLFRLFLPIPVCVFHFGAIDPIFFHAFLNMHLPHWLFPVPDLAQGPSSHIVQDFYNRVQPGKPIPYQAWVVPLLGWGIFLFAMLGTFVALAFLVRPQWAVNERLAFPIAQIELALIEQPRPGHMLNDLLGNPVFWIGLVLVFMIRSLQALHVYFPRTFPPLPTGYYLGNILPGEPWRNLSNYVKGARIFFTFIGVTYFIQSRIAFSLWALVLATEFWDMQAKSLGHDMAPSAWRDQNLGACVAYTIGFLWIGRHYWWNILQQTVGRSVADARTHLPPAAARTAVVTVALGIAIMVLWLGHLGLQAWVIVLIVGLILMTHLATSRVVAETGLTFFRCINAPDQIFTNLPTRLMSGKDVLFMGIFHSLGAINTRESTLTFTLHGLQVNQSQIESQPPPASTAAAPRRRSGLGAMALLIAWSLLLGFFICSWSSLHCYYTYSTPLPSNASESMINGAGSEGFPRNNMILPVDSWAAGQFSPKPKGYNPWLHMSIGAGITAFLQVMALRFSAWPLLPVGYLFSHTIYSQEGWFSIMLGWMIKVLIVRFGGARLYQRAKPFFIGLIFGEALTVGFWLVVNLLLISSGKGVEFLRFLPD